MENLLGRGAEDLTLEFKGAMAWEGSRPERLEIIRDIICMANARGGHILVGVAERSGRFEPIGLTAEQQTSFDQTNIGILASRYFAPPPHFTVRTASLNGLRFVLIEVQEFEETPIVCTNDSNRTVRAGAIYRRTATPSCEEVRSEHQMRQLIDQAVTKRGDSLLAQIADLINTSGTVPEQVSLPTIFEPDIQGTEEYLEQAGPEPPYWQLTIHPLVANVALPRRQIDEALRRSAVHQRGWDFPHIDAEALTTFESGRESRFEWQWYQESFRAYQSGLFAWRGRSTEEFTPDQGVAFVSAIYTVTEFLLFAADYADTAYAQQGIRLCLEARGLRQRRLSAPPSAHLSQRYVASVDSYRVEREIGYPRLRAMTYDIAAELLQEFFELFEWYESAGAVADWQSRFREGRF